VIASLLEQHMTEGDWLTQVVDYAHLRGWLVSHQRPGRTSNGWRTAIQGDAGFPDLVMVREGRVIFAELKSQRGRVGEAQKPWLEELAKVSIEASNVVVALWRPGDWEAVREALR
jgi:hypothetical protein